MTEDFSEFVNFWESYSKVVMSTIYISCVWTIFIITMFSWELWRRTWMLLSWRYIFFAMMFWKYVKLTQFIMSVPSSIDFSGVALNYSNIFISGAGYSSGAQRNISSLLYIFVCRNLCEGLQQTLRSI